MFGSQDSNSLQTIQALRVDCAERKHIYGIIASGLARFSLECFLSNYIEIISLSRPAMFAHISFQGKFQVSIDSTAFSSRKLLKKQLSCSLFCPKFILFLIQSMSTIFISAPVWIRTIISN